MHILIDARVIQDHFPGIGRYVFNLISALAPQLDGELFVLVDTNAVNTRYDLSQFAQHRNIKLIPTKLSIFSWRSQVALPGLIQALSPDLVHFPYNVRPLRLDIPSILTLYDVIPRRFPEYFPRVTRWKIEIIQRAALRASDAFVVISQSTANDFHDLFGLPQEEIMVTPLAPDPVFHPRPPAELDAFRKQKNLSERYMLYLGSNKPHKNLPRLIRAWAKVSQRLKVKSQKLVVAGHWDARYPQAKELAAALGVSESVRFWGPVSGQDLPLLYAAARAFIFPSQYEGFGLPVLEAMASGVPVACSRAPGLTEVAGDAALFFNPISVDELANALYRLGTDESMRERLSRLGTERASDFSWKNTAQRTKQAYQKLMNRS